MNMISWQSYNQTLIPLIQKFGAIHYSKETIQKGYFYWKSKNQADLLDEVNRSISFNQPFELVAVQDNSKRPERGKWSPDPCHITDGALDRILEANNVTSVLELLDKERERVRLSKV